MDRHEFNFEGRLCAVERHAQGIWALHDYKNPARPEAYYVHAAVGAEILKLASEAEALLQGVATIPDLEQAILARVRRELLAKFKRAEVIWEGCRSAIEVDDILAAVDDVCPEHPTPPAHEAEEPCQHEPSGMEDIVGTLRCSCGVAHSRQERCARCDAWVPWHDFPGRELQR